MDVRAPEFRGKVFPVLLTDGHFQLVDTTVTDADLANYQNAWVWHMCDQYERIAGGDDVPMIGLLSNSEMYKEQCKYCQLRVPAGMIATWKMMNWNHSEEYTQWVEDEEMDKDNVSA